MQNLGQASLAAVKQYLRLAQAKGINAESLLESARLPTSLLFEESGRISGTEFQTLLEKMLEMLPSPVLGLLSGDHVQPSSYSVLGYILMSCTNLAEAIAQISPYEKLVGDMGSTQILAHGDEIRIHWHCNYPQPNVRMHMVDNVFGSWISFANWLGNSTDEHPLRVELQRNPPADEYLAEYKKRWHCPVVFKQPHNCIVIHKGQLALPIRQGAPELKPALQQHAEAQLQQLETDVNFTQKVASCVHKLLQFGSVSQEKVASKLNISIRTMQRKLKEEGANYQHILDEERRAQAEFLLLNSQYSLTDISEQMGFTETSSFTRSFKAWTGMTPGKFRSKS